MELPRLAAKQKRYMDVLRYATTERIDPITKPKLLTALKEYQSALTACWRSQGGSPSEELRVASLERDLDNLFNDARLRSSAP
jgi:hypothetical protein